MIYASDMWLRSYQVEQLIELVDCSNAGPIKFYVYKMSQSSVMKKGKMVRCCLLEHETVHLLLQSFYLLDKYHVCYIIVAIFIFGQEFGAKYTEDYLKPYLENPLKVLVECNPCLTPFEVTMKMGEKRPKAIIATGWAKAMAEFKLEEGEIVVFSFTPCTGESYGLHLDLIRLVL